MRLALAAAAATLTATPAFSAAEDVFGYWLTENQKAIVQVEPCGAQACGKIVWLAEPNDPATGAPKVDANNEDAAMQARPICGMPMIGNFAQDGDRWDDGFIYDPQSGDTYTSKMHVNDAGKLYVRGYVGISLFGKSQEWTRVADARGGC